MRRLDRLSLAQMIHLSDWPRLAFFSPIFPPATVGIKAPDLKRQSVFPREK